MCFKIGDFEFGEVYGENEVLFFDNYLKYFYDINNLLSKFDRKNKMFVIGRKGMGKILFVNVYCNVK